MGKYRLKKDITGVFEVIGRNEKGSRVGRLLCVILTTTTLGRTKDQGGMEVKKVTSFCC